MKKSILVIAGASGVGKTSIASVILSDTEKFGLVRSLTTRAPRGDAHDGEYLYTDREDFAKRASEGELIEFMEYGDNLYGTPCSELDRIFAENKIPLLILDLEGVKSLRKKDLGITPRIFYIWDDLNVIEKRLYSRDLAEPTAEKLLSFLKRKEANIRDYLSLSDILHHFDAFVKNVGISETAENIKALFEDFLIGKKIDTQKNAEAANALSEMAKAKLV